MSNRVDLQPAFVLHTRLYRETSLLLDCLTLDHGRIGLIARGARRPKSPFAGILQPFIPLVISYLGAGELKTLTQAEPHGLFNYLTGERLASGLYLNELCVRLLLSQAAVPELFSVYTDTVQIIAGDLPLAPALRLFEKQLLSSMGYDLCLHQDAEQQPIDPDAQYLYDPDRGPYRVLPQEGMSMTFKGKTFLDLASGDLSDPVTCAQSKKLLQPVIHKLLGGKQIFSRSCYLPIR